VIAFTTGGRASLLGGSHLDGIPLGEPTWFPEPRAKQLLQMAALGPWIENARPTTAGTSRSIFAADTKAVINAPLIWHERLVGVISFGTLTEPATGLMEERLATTREFGVVGGAVLGPAIETRSFRPVFQPIVELSTGTIVGYEALTRFHDGKRPDRRFVDAAAAGLGIQLEVACLRAAQREAVRLPMGRYLSINVSPEMATALIPLLATLEGIEREIVIEITEQAHVVSYARLRDALEKVRGHARIAVDDAGAGYAGLQHILEIRPHIVKLDIALVRGVNADPARRALIGSMAAFAAETEATLLAEGIETEEELATLRGLGVELGQGYLLGRPAGVDDLEESHRAVA
jgi:EAL domain-containing protein (putative c-di-GMP-specific phosphodiesterase class I)